MLILFFLKKRGRDSPWLLDKKKAIEVVILVFRLQDSQNKG